MAWREVGEVGERGERKADAVVRRKKIDRHFIWMVEGGVGVGG